MDVEFIRYKFENGYDGVITKNKFKIGVRHLQMLYMFMTSMVFGFIRGSMGIAVLAMTSKPQYGDPHVQIHYWDERIKGAILSSFFFGYAVMLIPAELYLKRIGGKWLMTFILLVNGALTAAMPTIANKGGWIAVCNAKLIIGLSHGCLFTVNQSLINHWLPPNERKFFNFFIYGGVQIGMIIALAVTGKLKTAHLGWELVYYTLAMMAFSMAAITLALTASSPEVHEAVGDNEKAFIKENLDSYRKKNLRTPWRKIIKSAHFWALIGSHVASNVLFTFYLVYAPTWLRDVKWFLDFRLSFISTSFPFIAMTVVYLVMSPLTDWICSWSYFNCIIGASLFRKVINCLGAVGIVLGLMMWPNSIHDWNFYSICAFIAILGLLGFQFCGFLSSYKDMTENYSGSLMMLSCTISSVAGAAVPFVNGLILAEKMWDPARWRIIKLTIASLYIVSTVIYTLFGIHNRRQWDHISDKDIGHHNGTMNESQIQLEEYGQSKNPHNKQAIDTVL